MTTPSTAADRLSKLVPLLIPFFYMLVLLWMGRVHDTFWEWGGVMQVFAGREMLSGQGYVGWASHFWPPLFPLLTGIGQLFASGFLVGKLIGIASSALLLVVAYHLALELYADRNIALISQLCIGANPTYFYESFQAHNHLLDAFFVSLGILLFLKAINAGSWRRMILPGLVCGLAFLTRYQSFVLTLLPLSLFLFTKPKRGAAQLLGFALGFAAVASPWFYYNTIRNGSPFATWEYLNLGAEIYPGEKIKWWWDAQSHFDSVASIVAAYPLLYVENVFRNIPSVFRAIVVALAASAPFAIPGLFDGVLRLKREHLVPLGVLFGAFFILFCQAFVPNYQLLSFVVLFTIIGVAFAVKHSAMMIERFAFLRRVRYDWLLLFACVGVSAVFAFRNSFDRIYDRFGGGTLPEINLAVAKLREHDKNLAGKTIMAIDPGWAYHAGCNYLQTPGWYKGTLPGLVQYAGLNERVRNYAAKFPTRISPERMRADYLVYTKMYQDPFSIFPVAEPDGFSFLFDPASPNIPRNFTPVYVSNTVALYAIRWDGDSLGAN